MKLFINYALNLTAAQREELQQSWPGLEILEQRSGPVDKINGAGIGVLVTDQVPSDLSSWPDLRWVQLLSAGANPLLGHPVFRTTIPVTTASGTHGVPIAQYVTCTWLMMAHRMPQVLDFQRTRSWPDRISLAGFSVRGLTAGIIGFGSIGRECARQLSALGMRILCVKRTPANRADTDYNAWDGSGDPQGKIPEAWFAPDQLGQMLPQCDLVVVTAPATPATSGMIGPAEFGQMKQGARMIIISRGGIVQERALAEALRSGHLAEAVVDCFVQEPLPPDHFYFDVPNLILTPHVSGVSNTFATAFFPLLADNLRRFKAGLPLMNRANSETGY